jgi:hypothetical protein
MDGRIRALLNIDEDTEEHELCRVPRKNVNLLRWMEYDVYREVHAIYGTHDVTPEELNWVRMQDYESIICHGRRKFSWLFFQSTNFANIARFWYGLLELVISRKTVWVDNAVMTNFVIKHYSLQCVPSGYIDYFCMRELDDGKQEFAFKWMVELLVEKPEGVTLLDTEGDELVGYTEDTDTYSCDLDLMVHAFIYKGTIPVTMMEWGEWERSDRTREYKNVVKHNKDGLCIGFESWENAYTLDRYGMYVPFTIGNNTASYGSTDIPLERFLEKNKVISRSEYTILPFLPTQSVNVLYLKYNPLWIPEALRVAGDVRVVSKYVEEDEDK